MNCSLLLFRFAELQFVGWSCWLQTHAWSVSSILNRSCFAVGEALFTLVHGYAAGCHMSIAYSWQICTTHFVVGKPLATLVLVCVLELMRVVVCLLQFYLVLVMIWHLSL